MMRGPSAWSVAVRKPDGDIAEVNRPIASILLRHRWLRMPIVRGVIALGESLSIGFRALAISANYAAQQEGGRRGRDRAHARPAALRLRHRDRLRAPPLQGLPGADHELAADRVDRRFRGRRGPRARDDLHRVPAAHLAAARPEARLPVPRRRAQGDQRVRGGRRARPRDGRSASASCTCAAGRRSCSTSW